MALSAMTVECEQFTYLFIYLFIYLLRFKLKGHFNFEILFVKDADYALKYRARELLLFRNLNCAIQFLNGNYF